MFRSIFTVLLLFSNVVVLASAEATSKSWTLHHSFDSGKTFTERGTLTLGLKTDDNSKSLEMKLENNKDCIDIGDSTNLQSELYQLKITSNTNADTEIVTSVPACQIRRANYRDELIVTLNGNADPVSLDYNPLVSPLAPSCEEIISSTSSTSSDSPEFTTTKVKYETATVGMMIPNLLPETKPPVGLKFFPNSKLGGGKDGKGIPGEEPPKSFMVRYWYIILPLVLMSVLGGEDPSQQQQQGGGTPGAQGQAARAGAAATAGAAAAGAGAPRQRRGKR